MGEARRFRQWDRDCVRERKSNRNDVCSHLVRCGARLGLRAQPFGSWQLDRPSWLLHGTRRRALSRALSAVTKGRGTKKNSEALKKPSGGPSNALPSLLWEQWAHQPTKAFETPLTSIRWREKSLRDDRPPW